MNGGVERQFICLYVIHWRSKYRARYSNVQMFKTSLGCKWFKIKGHLKLLCISTSFQVLRAPESWLKHFFQLFTTFFVHFKPFSVISRLKSRRKVLKKRLNLVEWNQCEINKAKDYSFTLLAKLKTAEKSILTSFQVCSAPESWWKYTT